MQNHSNKHFPMNGKRKQVTHKPFVRGTEDQKGLHTDKKCANEHDLIRFNTIN